MVWAGQSLFNPFHHGRPGRVPPAPLAGWCYWMAPEQRGGCPEGLWRQAAGREAVLLTCRHLSGAAGGVSASLICSALVFNPFYFPRSENYLG